MEIYMKHTGSTAQDLDINYTINNDNTVTVEAAHFDSALMQSFLIDVLGQDHGIQVVRDDRTKNPPKPPYRVFLDLAGVRYEIDAHRLVMGGFTIALLPRPVPEAPCLP